MCLAKDYHGLIIAVEHKCLNSHSLSITILQLQAVEDNPLTKELAGESLSLLCRTGSGMAHAYVRIDLKDQ
jgi:hypothetical protein